MEDFYGNKLENFGYWFDCNLLVMGPRSSLLSRAGLILNAAYVN